MKDARYCDWWSKGINQVARQPGKELALIKMN
jgi:hypothetical protein